MNIYLTELTAIDLRTGELNTFVGERIEAPTIELAKEMCLTHYPYLKVIGKLIMEGGLKGGEPIDYDTIANN